MADLDYLAGFLRDNILDGAEIGSDSEATGYPVTDILDRRHDRPWRTQDGTAKITVDLGTAKPLSAFVFRVPSERDPDRPAVSRLAPADNVTIMASNTEGGSDLLNLTFQAGHNPRLGYVAKVLHAGGVLTPVTARYWEFEFASSSDWFEVENALAGEVWTPGFNINRGAGFGIDEAAEIGRSTFSGGMFAESRARLLEFVGSWSIWSQQELNDWEEFSLSHGTTRPFVLFRRLTGDLSKRVSISTFDGKPILTDQDGVHFLLRAAFKENR